MDAHLAARPYFVAKRYTIADIALYAYTHVAHEGGHDLAPYASVRSWLDRVAAQPGHVGIYARPRS
jgi:glutathione S-transferase